MTTQNAWQKLRQAIRDNDSEKVKELLTRSPELMLISEPNPCLHLAAREGHLQIVQLLIDMGADINQVVDLYNTSLDEASAKGHLGVVDYLIQQGANLEAPRPDRNPLFSAIDGGHTDVAKSLLHAGLDPHIVYRGESGKLKNALAYSMEDECAEIVALLVKAGCRLPIEGVDIPVWEPENIHELTNDINTHEEINAHVAEEFGIAEPLSLQEILPIHDKVHVEINVIRPNPGHPFLTLFTTGMSDCPMAVPTGQDEYQYAELIMHLPADWPHPRDHVAQHDCFWPCEWLRKIAYYPHLHNTWLGGPTTIISSDEPPVPLGPNTKQSCLLLIANFADWSPITLLDRRVLNFYTVVPLYSDERDHEKRYGVKSLLQRLKKKGFTAVVNVNRESVAEKKHK